VEGDEPSGSVAYACDGDEGGVAGIEVSAGVVLLVWRWVDLEEDGGGEGGCLGEGVGMCMFSGEEMVGSEVLIVAGI